MEILLHIVQGLLGFLAIATFLGGAPQGALVYGSAAIASFLLAAWWPVFACIVLMIVLGQLGIGIPK
jgi:hypothetical protein